MGKEKKEKDMKKVIIDFKEEAVKINKRNLIVICMCATFYALLSIAIVFAIQCIFGNFSIEDDQIKNAKETTYMIYNKGLDDLSSYNSKSRIIVNYVEPDDATKLMEKGLRYVSFPDMIEFKITEMNLWEKMIYKNNVFKFYDDLGIGYVKVYVKGDAKLLPSYMYSIGIKPEFIVIEIIFFIIFWVYFFWDYQRKKKIN